MPNSYFEKLRNHYRPDNIDILFVGESRPISGKFFIKRILISIEKPRKLLIYILVKIFLHSTLLRIVNAGYTIYVRIL
jgi:hypothetical protein